MSFKFVGRTTSNEVQINPSSVQYLEETLKDLGPTNLKMRFRRDNEALWFSIRGDGIFLLYNQNGDEVTEEVLRKISTHLLPGEELVVQSIGFEEYNYPFTMFKWSICQDKTTGYCEI